MKDAESSLVLVSIVVCSYKTDIFDDLVKLVTGLQNQTYPKLEIILVIDGNEALSRMVDAAYREEDGIRVVPLAKSVGISGARDTGIKVAKGEIIAFVDDDVAVEPGWVAALVDTHRKYDAIAVGGKVLPIWLTRKPRYLPEELYWLLGLTYKGYAEDGVAEVRNALGCNMSFQRRVFATIGGFDQGLGFADQGNSFLQGEEPELALRMKERFGKGVIYNPELVVYHSIQDRKVKPVVLLKRTFFQGYSKAIIKRSNNLHDTLATEYTYLRDILFRYVPRRIKKLFASSGKRDNAGQLVVLVLAMLTVSAGFICGFVVPRPHRPSGDIGPAVSDDEVSKGTG